MFKIVLSTALPLFLLGGCSTLEDWRGGHDSHHPKEAATAPAIPGSSSPAMADMAPSSKMMGDADGMKNCPQMKSDGVSAAGKMNSPSGMMKNCPSSEMMKNCPQMKDGGMMQGEIPNMPMSGSMQGMSGDGQMTGGMMMNCPQMENNEMKDAPH